MMNLNFIRCAYRNKRRVLDRVSLLPKFSSSPVMLKNDDLSSIDNSSYSKIGVVGLGLMGHGICQTAASSKNTSSIIAYESEERFLTSGKSRIDKSIDKLLSKEKITQKFADETLKKITYTTDISALNDVDLVVEAVIEDMDLKKKLYNKLGVMCNPETVFASNTSSLSISEMALASGRPEKFVGIHFFNPVQLMKLVEVIKTDKTCPKVYQNVYNWVGKINKVAVSCKDTPGFIVNRLLVPSLLQAMLMVERQDGSVADIDISMSLGAGHPMGPLHLADYIGLDTCYFIVKGWTKKYPDEPAFIVPQILQDKVDAGNLGRKTGKGFYNWDGDKRGDPI